jgi:hypothetical protein
MNFLFLLSALLTFTYAKKIKKGNGDGLNEAINGNGLNEAIIQNTAGLYCICLVKTAKTTNLCNKGIEVGRTSSFSSKNCGGLIDRINAVKSCRNSGACSLSGKGLYTASCSYEKSFEQIPVFVNGNPC